MFLAVFFIVLLLVFGASRHALQRYESAIATGRRQKAPLPFTGEEIALEFLKESGVTDVQVVEHNGVVTDYFDPARRRLFLSSAFKDGRHLAAWAVALHEAAHALQIGETLSELNWRRSCIKMTRYLPTLTALILLAFVFMKMLPFRTAFMAAISIWALPLLLNIGTLAVERNANLRLRKFLDDRLRQHPSARDDLDPILSATALREVGDLLRSPRYFFFSALPGTSKSRPG